MKGQHQNWFVCRVLNRLFLVVSLTQL